MRHHNQTSGSNLVGLILAVLDDGPLHGYGIAREIEARSADTLSYGEGTLYPALKALERDGLIEGTWDTTADRGPARKVYVITIEGKKELSKIRDAWTQYSRSMDSVLKGRPRPATA